MFFVLRRPEDGRLYSGKNDAGIHLFTTVLNEAKVFNMRLEPGHDTMQFWKGTNGKLECEVIGDQIPGGLEGVWEIAPVELKLA